MDSGRDASDSDLMGWFHQQLTVEERVALVSSPYSPLPGSLATRLAARPGVSASFWVSNGNPLEWTLEATTARRLMAAVHQLDYWWQRLTDEQRAYITVHRNGVLDAEYAAIVQNASSNPVNDSDALVVVVVRDVNDGHRFRLPAIVHAYVEMLAR